MMKFLVGLACGLFLAWLWPFDRLRTARELADVPRDDSSRLHRGQRA